MIVDPKKRQIKGTGELPQIYLGFAAIEVIMVVMMTVVLPVS